MSVDPPIVDRPYGRQLQGVYGEFGAGGDVQAFYLQSALTPAQLAWVSLISDIRGSEQWPVRDLFQRDIDNARVTDSLLPYLKAREKVKFFNPLTLTILPMKSNGHTVMTEMPRVEDSEYEESGRIWDVRERADYYRIRWMKDNHQYAVLEWNEEASRLVAIDGQHRLSALKRLQNDADDVAHADLMNWRIPVVIVSFRAGPGKAEPPKVLNVVRNIFMYINTKAREVNRARQILLADESVNAVCVQQLLNRSHENDLKPHLRRDPRRIPLLFYDWRAEESGGERIHSPAAIKRIEEVCDWLKYYLLGDNSEPDEQETALDVDPSHQLHTVFHDRKLDHTNSEDLRRHADQKFLPAISYMLENFAPYRSYIEELRHLEKQYVEDGSDISHHAFHHLRFGTNHAADELKYQVDDKREEIRDRIDKLKAKYLKTPIDQDVGMRGIVSAFGKLRREFGYVDWVAFSKWFTRALNEAYEAEWFHLPVGRRKRSFPSKLRKAPHAFLRHVIEGHDGGRVNYRLQDADDALGTYVAILVARYGQPWPDSWQGEWEELKEDLLETLRDTLIRGYKKEIRPELRVRYPNGGRELTEAVKADAIPLAEEHINKFEEQLKKVNG